MARFLSARGIGTAIYYPKPLHLQECFGYLAYKPGHFPEAERASRESLALPVYPELSAAMQTYVIDTVGAFFQAREVLAAEATGKEVLTLED